jgi:hypothetical protein
MGFKGQSCSQAIVLPLDRVAVYILAKNNTKMATGEIFIFCLIEHQKLKACEQCRYGSMHY